MRHILVVLSLLLAACASDPQQGEEPRCEPDPSCAGCEPYSPEERCLRCAVADHVAVCAPGLVPLCTFNGQPPEWAPDIVEGRPVNGYNAFCPTATQQHCGVPGSSSSIEATAARDMQPIEVRCWCPRDSTDPDCRVTE